MTSTPPDDQALTLPEAAAALVQVMMETVAALATALRQRRLAELAQRRADESATRRWAYRSEAEDARTGRDAR